MPTFFDLFLAEIKRKPQLGAFWSKSPLCEIESTLSLRLQKFWVNYWKVEKPIEKGFAVDGSMAERNFNNATSIFFGQALLLGPGLEERASRLELYRGTIDRGTRDRLNSLYLRDLEISLALDHLEEMKGGVLFLDGSLYSTLPHLLYPLASTSPPGEDPALSLLKKILQFLKEAKEKNVSLICLSKSSSDVLLARRLLISEQEEDLKDEEFARSNQEVIPDVELLCRFTDGSGYTLPLILGKMAFLPRHHDIFSDEKELARRFALNEEDALEICQALWESPLHALFFWRPAPWEDPIRVDFPCYGLGTLRQHNAFFLNDWPEIGSTLSTITHFWGGEKVYNAPLYQVDKEVRLTSKTLETYLKLLRNELEEPFVLDRSSRRFFS